MLEEISLARAVDNGVSFEVSHDNGLLFLEFNKNYCRTIPKPKGALERAFGFVLEEHPYGMIITIWDMRMEGATCTYSRNSIRKERWLDIHVAMMREN